MGRFLMSFASAEVLGKAMSFASLAIVFNLIPLMLAWLPGIEMSEGSWSISILNPLDAALAQFAPPGLRFFIVYFYLDLALTLRVTGLVWGLAKDVVIGGAK